MKTKDNSQSTLKRLINYILKDHKAGFIIVFICILISAIGSTAVAFSFKILLDGYIVPLSQQITPDYTNFYKALMILGAVFLTGVVASFIYNRLMAKIGQNILKKLRDDMFSHMQNLPISYFDKNTNGSIMSLYTNDTDTLRQMINQAIPQILQSIFTVIVTVISMIILSPILTVAAGIMVIIMFFVVRKMTGISGKFFGYQQKNIASITGFIEERITGQRVVKIFNHEEKSKQEFDELNEKLFESAKTANIYVNNIPPVISNIGNITFVITAVFGAILSINNIGNITIGVLVSYLQFSKSFTQPFMQIAQQLNSVVLALAGTQRIFELLDEQVEQDEGYVTLVDIEKDEKNGIIPVPYKTGMWGWKHPHSDGRVTYEELKGDIKIFDMDFSYVEGKKVLQNISLYAKPGQKIAFVGATGAGKTTITNLINRFYDIDDGKIRYDDININKIKKESLRRSLGVVLQDTKLFTGTIAENIRYGKLDATDEEVINAAKLAQADGFINMLSDGYNTVISGSGEELSQGQKQLISIARAAISNPPVLILDEATSNIDTRTEAIVQKGMDNLMKGRTVFVIAHRLSTIKNSDAIMVLDHGRIIERGYHEELIAQKGEYYKLYTGKTELD